MVLGIIRLRWWLENKRIANTLHVSFRTILIDWNCTPVIVVFDVLQTVGIFTVHQVWYWIFTAIWLLVHYCRSHGIVVQLIIVTDCWMVIDVCFRWWGWKVYRFRFLDNVYPRGRLLQFLWWRRQGWRLSNRWLRGTGFVWPRRFQCPIECTIFAFEARGHYLHSILVAILIGGRHRTIRCVEVIETIRWHAVLIGHIDINWLLDQFLEKGWVWLVAVVFVGEYLFTRRIFPARLTLFTVGQVTAPVRAVWTATSSASTATAGQWACAD